MCQKRIIMGWKSSYFKYFGRKKQQSWERSKNKNHIKRKENKRVRKKEITKEKARGKKKGNEIKPEKIEFHWGKKHDPFATEQCSLGADIIQLFRKHHIPFNVCSAGNYLDGLVKLLVDENNFSIFSTSKMVENLKPQ